MVFDRPLPRIKNLDWWRYHIWKYRSKKYQDVDVCPYFFCDYFYGNPKRGEPLNKRINRFKSVFEKHKHISIKKLFSIPKPKPEEGFREDVDEIDIAILYNMWVNTVSRPFSEPEGSTSMELLKCVGIARRHLDERIKKLENLKLIKRDSYSLSSLDEKFKGRKVLNFINTLRPYPVERVCSELPPASKEVRGYPSVELISFLLDSRPQYTEIQFSLQHLSRIRGSKKFSLKYKARLKKHIILCFIELGLLK